MNRTQFNKAVVPGLFSFAMDSYRPRSSDEDWKTLVNAAGTVRTSSRAYEESAYFAGYGTVPGKGEGEAVVQTPQGPIPVSQASQMIGQMMQQIEQMGQELEKAGVMDKQIAGMKLEIDQFRAETERLRTDSQNQLDDARIKEMIFNAVKEYVDRTPGEDSGLLAPGGAKAEQTAGATTQ